MNYQDYLKEHGVIAEAFKPNKVEKKKGKKGKSFSDEAEFEKALKPLKLGLDKAGPRRYWFSQNNEVKPKAADVKKLQTDLEKILGGTFTTWTNENSETENFEMLFKIGKDKWELSFDFLPKKLGSSKPAVQGTVWRIK